MPGVSHDGDNSDYLRYKYGQNGEKWRDVDSNEIQSIIAVIYGVETVIIQDAQNRAFSGVYTVFKLP
jgi:hypothetical protein